MTTAVKTLFVGRSILVDAVPAQRKSPRLCRGGSPWAWLLPRNHFLALVSLFRSKLRDKPAVGLSVSDVILSAFPLIPTSRGFSWAHEPASRTRLFLSTTELPCRVREASSLLRGNQSLILSENTVTDFSLSFHIFQLKNSSFLWLTVYFIAGSGCSHVMNLSSNNRGHLLRMTLFGRKIVESEQ